MTKRLAQAFQNYDNGITKNSFELSGILGVPIGGQRLVQVPTRNSFVYVRLRDNQSELIQAFNNQVSPAYDLPVIVAREGNKYVIKGVDSARYENNWPSFSPYLPMHGNTHSFTPDDTGGGDMVWVYGRQFMPMLAFPSGSLGGPNVIVADYVIKDINGNWKFIGSTGTQNITQYKPTGSSAMMVLVYVNSTTGNPGLVVGSGSHFASNLTGTNQLIQYVPTLGNNPVLLPTAAIRLVSGTSSIGWDNIYDVRQHFAVIPTGTSGGLSSIAVQEEGGALGNVTTFNFVGGRLLASVAGATARIEVSPDPQELIGIMGQSQGVPIGTGTILNVSGPGALSISRSGTVLDIYDYGIGSINAGILNQSAGGVVAIYFTGSGVQAGFGTVSGEDAIIVNIPGTVAPTFPQDNIGVMIWDEGVPKATGTILNFVGANIDASVSGSVVRIFVTGSSGGGIPSGTVQVFNTGSFVGSADQFDFQYPLAVGITGSKAYPYFRGSLFVYEDVSYLVSGTNAHFSISGTITNGTDRLYYNGLRQQRNTHYTVDANGRGFQTLFTGTWGDTMIIEYGSAAVGTSPYPVGIYDDGSFVGQAGGINFANGLSAVVDGNGIAQISGSSASEGSGDFVKLFDFTIGQPTGAIVFAGIPQTYSHLLIKASMRGATGTSIQGELAVEANGDTSFSNYSKMKVTLYPSGTVSGGAVESNGNQSTSSNLFGHIPGKTAVAGVFSSDEINIVDYRSTVKYKAIHRKGAIFGAGNLEGDTMAIDIPVWWENTAAINTLVIRGGPTGEMFASGTRATMYGLK